MKLYAERRIAGPDIKLPKLWTARYSKVSADDISEFFRSLVDAARDGFGVGIDYCGTEDGDLGYMAIGIFPWPAFYHWVGSQEGDWDRALAAIKEQWDIRDDYLEAGREMLETLEKMKDELTKNLQPTDVLTLVFEL